MKLLTAAVFVCLLTACTAQTGKKPDYRHAAIEVINETQTQQR
ncbi:MAG: hypothetical protein ACRC4K_10270 [Plesiomonas shigelloides]